MNYEEEIDSIPIYNQYDGKFPVLVPDYKDKQYITHFQKIKTIIQNKEYTLVANHLAELVLNKLASNYNCWYVKRMCLDKGILDLQTELTWTRAFLLANVKNFQGWEYRRYLREKSGTVSDELDYLDQVLDLEQKNYHVWAYKVLLTERFNLFEQEKTRILKWLELDLMNNSAWSYRHFLFSRTIKQPQDLQKEIEFVFTCINKNKNNIAVWNYLRGWFPSIKLKSIPSSRAQQHSTPLFEYKQFPQVLQFCLNLAKEDQNAVDALVTLVHIHSHSPQNVEYALSISQVLAAKQKQKQTYWKWIHNNLPQKQLPK